MTESGVCVCVCFSSCSCTHTHCARRGIINCPCSAIVNLLANLQGVLKSQPFQGPQYTSPSTPVSFPLPRAEHPRSTWPIPGYMPGGSVLSHIPRAQAQEKSMKKSTPVYSARIGTHLIQLGTDFAVETTLMKLSSYAQRDPASPGFHALLPLTQYTTTFRRR